MSAYRPRCFYKFFSKERFDFLSTLQLRYAPHDSFNDPFENRPSKQEEMDNLSHEEASALRASLRDDSTYSNELVNKTLSHRFRQDSDFPNVEDYKEKLGTLCLSETHDNLLMWAHYASEHKGFVVEFNASYFFDFSDKSEEKVWLFSVDRVKYREMRVLRQSHGWWDYFHGTPHEVATTKSTHWSHEQEWRMTRPLKDANPVIEAKSTALYSRDESNHLIHLFDIPKKYVSKIILGARASKEDLARVKHTLAEDGDLAHVKLKLAIPDPVDFRLRFINIKVEDLPDAEPQGDHAP